MDRLLDLQKYFADIRVEKIKITGVEPTIRSDIIILVKSLSSFLAIKSISMTTIRLLLSDDKIKAHNNAVL